MDSISNGEELKAFELAVPAVLGKNYKMIIATITQLFLSSKKIVVVTGAGISSNVPNIKQVAKDTFGLTYKEMHSLPISYPEWIQSHAKFIDFINLSEPSEFHLWILKSIQLGKVAGYVTQNIDGLERKVGIEKELDLKLEYCHGNYMNARCFSTNNESHRIPLQPEILAAWRTGTLVPCLECRRESKNRHTTRPGLRKVINRNGTKLY